MRVLPNIIPIGRIYGTLPYLNEYKRQIEEGRRTGDREAEKAAILSATSSWGKNVLRVMDVNLTVKGKENLPTEGPVVYISNHQAYADIPSLCAALDTVQFGFVAKQNLAKIPLYGSWILRIRGLLMERGDVRSSLKTIQDGIKLIEDGFSLLIFPEGTRSRGGRMHEFKKGSLRLATKTGAPVIPVTVDGTSWFFEENGGVLRKGGDITVTIHPKIETKGLDKHELNALPERVQKIVESALPPEKRYVPEDEAEAAPEAAQDEKIVPAAEAAQDVKAAPEIVSAAEAAQDEKAAPEKEKQDAEN